VATGRNSAGSSANIAWGSNSFGITWHDGSNVGEDIYFVLAKYIEVQGISNNPLNFESGWLVKTTDSPKAYYVNEYYCLQWILSEEVAVERFGSNWYHNLREFDNFEGYSFYENIK
ncbi:hypothetical protein K8R32_01550, partial [bacterium]|nr:hypothetical protein [bacterium]